MDMQSLKNASATELNRLLVEARSKLHDLRFQAATRQLTKVRQIRALRREIAQILTVLGTHV